MLENFNIKNYNLIQNPMVTILNFFLNDGEDNIESNLLGSLIGSLLYVGHT